MAFSIQEVKGLNKCLVDEDIDANQLSVHISEVESGDRAHPPHRHRGVEAFYMLEGNGTVEIEDKSYSLGPNSAILLDPRKLHGLINTGTTKMRYMVIIARS